jgi:hypothetical protein
MSHAPARPPRRTHPHQATRRVRTKLIKLRSTKTSRPVTMPTTLHEQNADSAQRTVAFGLPSSTLRTSITALLRLGVAELLLTMGQVFLALTWTAAIRQAHSGVYWAESTFPRSAKSPRQLIDTQSSGRWGTRDTDDLPVRSAAARGVVPSQIVRARAVSTSSVVASSAILGKMARRLLRWAPSSGSVTASVTIVSS